LLLLLAAAAKEHADEEHDADADGESHQNAGERAAETVVHEQRREPCADGEACERSEPFAHSGSGFRRRCGGRALGLCRRIRGGLLLRGRFRRRLLRGDRLALGADAAAASDALGLGFDRDH
jgi:hypothetical protein